MKTPPWEGGGGGLITYPADFGSHKRFAAWGCASKVVAGLKGHIRSPSLSLLPWNPLLKFGKRDQNVKSPAGIL